MKISSKIIEERFDNYKKHAKSLNLSFSLKKERVAYLLKQECWYCGSEKCGFFIDRPDSTKGYSLKNAVSACYKCIKMKDDMSEGEFMEHISRIYNQNNGDDDKTRSIHIIEKNIGDRQKNVLKEIFDMVSIDNMQKSEIKSLLTDLVEQHVLEIDEFEK